MPRSLLAALLALIPIVIFADVMVPAGRVTSPGTSKDFVGTGVVPDIQSPADEALEVALNLAAQSPHGNRPGAGAKP